MQSISYLGLKAFCHSERLQLRLVFK